MRALRLVLLVTLMLLIAFLCLEVHQKEQQKRKLTSDLIELSDIKYGMFNVDTWAGILADIIAKKVKDFDITQSNKEELRKRISAFLYTTISDFEDRYYEENRGVGGFLRKSVASMTNIFGKMKEDVPTFTEDIIKFLDDPANKQDFREYILKELTGYANETFSDMDYGVRDDILAIHGYPSGDAAIQGLQQQIAETENKISGNKQFLFSLIIGTALLAMLLRGPNVNELSILSSISVILLISGLSLPMIDIDARISEMNFNLLGETITFNDQVLYFMSKSILEIVQIMLTQGDFDVLIVGLLVFLFSVLFPVLKLICSFLYLYIQSLRANRLVKFMAFKTGKWSMADVMVIAIFMAYIGFSGILSEQLGHLGKITNTVEILTTNRTQLQTGFFLFTAFAVISLLVSHRMQHSLSKTEE